MIILIMRLWRVYHDILSSGIDKCDPTKKSVWTGYDENCCTTSNPCGEKQGGCKTDAQCGGGNLVCSDSSASCGTNFVTASGQKCCHIKGNIR